MAATKERHAVRAPELLRVNEVAEMLKCSTRKITNMVQARRMPGPLRVGGSLRWKATDIATWIENGCVSVAEAVTK